MEPLLIRRIIEKLAEDHRSRYPHRDIRLQAPEALMPVTAAEVYVEQVIRNLLSNAEKYSPPQEPIDVVIEPRGAGIGISVMDRGIGVPEEEGERIFDAFYRSHSAGHVAGVGIGLAVCRRLIEAQGGEITYEPRPGGGSSFMVALPGYDEDLI